MMNSVIDKLKNTKKDNTDKSLKQSAPGVKVGGSGRIANSNNGEISLADLLHNAGNKGKPNNTNNHESSPSGGEKLLRLLSVSEQRPDDENKENGGSVAAFFAQVSQASSTGVGPPPPPGLPAGARGMNPIQSLFTDPAVVSVEALENQPPPMPVAAKAASDLEHDMKPTKAKKAGHGANKTPNKTPNKNKPTKPLENDNSVNNGSISCASVAAATQPPPPPTETTAPQLMSPMVFAGQDHQSSPGPQGGLPQGGPPHGGPPGLPTVLHPKPVPTLPNPMQTIPPPVMPLNGVPFHLPVPAPQVTPLTEAQLMQAFQHLLRTDRGFVSKLHQAYVESLNTQLH